MSTIKTARLALARFAVQALGLYIKEVEADREPTMTLMEIATAIIEVLNADL